MNPRVHPLHTDIEPPQQLNDPFNYEPHPLCILAAEEVKKYVRAHEELLEDAEKGEMFGVLIVTPLHLPRGGELDPVQDTPPRGSQRGVSFLAAYAGLLAQRNDWDWFVPPIFDAQQPDGRFKQTEAKISALNHQIEQLTDEKAILELKHRRKEMSNELLLWLFSQYNLINYKGEVRNVVDIWRDYHNSPKLLRKFPLPPGGTGECCAPKLFQYAFQHGLQPLAIAEFWWGESPKREIRHHFQFYPACNGKCKPILTWQLKRLSPRPPYREGAITSETDKNSLPSGGAGVGCRGTISLPLAPDYLDRPRQVVDYEEGKPAVTDYEIIGQEGPYYRVLLTPHTGRTHQLRVHCAHQDGLGMPIVGDDLYGFHSDRLYLHAEYLTFTHPLTGEKMEFEKAPDF